jgi:uncharacterized alkaline shock family protein YloU
MNNWETFLTAVADLPWYEMLGASAATLAFLWLLIRLSNRGKTPEILAFETGGGKVTVSLHAISELIQRAAASTDGVARCSSRISQRRGQLQAIRLKIHLRASSHLREVEESLQKRIAHTLRVTLGIEQMGSIDTIVAGLVGEPEVPQDPEPEEPRKEKPTLIPGPAFTPSGSSFAPVPENSSQPEPAPGKKTTAGENLPEPSAADSKEPSQDRGKEKN